jgi:hypothetical protein
MAFEHEVLVGCVGVEASLPPEEVADAHVPPCRSIAPTWSTS